MRLIDADAIKIPKGFFEKVDNVPKFYDWLDDQPTIEAEPVKHGRWIPVSERLPEENSDILVTYVEKDEKRIVPVNYGCGTWFDCLFNKVLDLGGVLAWMPLPEPYKEKKHETD